MKKEVMALVLSMVTTVAIGEDLGKITYETACKNCHAPNLAKAIKSPPAFDEKAWKVRFDKAGIESKNNPSQFKTPLDYLLYSVKIGKGLMYHGGLCKESELPKENCTDEAFVGAINYMSKKH